MNKEFTFVEVCAVAGGLSSGFIEAGFKALLLNENHKKCCQTLKKNHNNIDINEGSMIDLDLKKYNGNVDILM